MFILSESPNLTTTPALLMPWSNMSETKTDAYLNGHISRGKKAYRRERPSTVDLLVLTSLD